MKARSAPALDAWPGAASDPGTGNDGTVGDKPLAVRRWLALLAALSALGGLTFLPFLAAGSCNPMTELRFGFRVLVTVIAAVAA